MDEPLQKSLERYDVLDRIAVGGMAEVFLAKAYGAHGFEKTIAIKRILPELARDPEFAARFIAEAKVAVKLSHANVVQVFDFGRYGESLFIAMEFVDGLDLAQLLRKFKDEKRQLPLPAAFHIAIEIMMWNAAGSGTSRPSSLNLRRSAARSSPSTNSIAMNRDSPMRPKSKTCPTLACDSRTATLASAMNRASNSGSRASSGKMRLIARVFSKPWAP